MGIYPGKQPLYAVPINNPDRKANETPIYRSPQNLSLDLFNFPMSFNTFHDMYKKSLFTDPQGDCIGYRQKNSDGSLQNIFTWYSREQVRRTAEEIGSGLMKLKLYTENREWNGFDMKLVGVYSKNLPQYIIMDIGMTMYGVSSVPLYDTLGVNSIHYILDQTKIKTCFLTANHVEKLMAEQKEKRTFKYLETLIVFDPENYDRSLEEKYGNVFKVYTLKEITEEGRKKILPWAKVTPDSVYMISYTSGTTGFPKGAIITHRNVSVMYDSVKETLNLNRDDIHICYLPLAHMFERSIYNLFLTECCRIGVYNGDVLKLREDMAILKPTFFVTVPRVLNKIHDTIKSNLNEIKGLKSRLVKRGIETKLHNLRYNCQFTHAFFDRMVFNKIKKLLGGRVRLMISGSAPISVEVLDFLKIAFCCPIIEGYGQTEGTAAEFITSIDDPASGHVGGPLLQNEYKLVDVPELNYTTRDKDELGRPRPRGEIWIRGRNVIPGYFLNPEEDTISFTKDNWMMSGDIGQINPVTNSLQIIDRKKNIFKLSQGEYIAPEKLENAYRVVHTAINDLYVYGDSLKSCIVGVVSIDKGSLRKFAIEYNVTGDIDELVHSSVIKKGLLNLFVKEAEKRGFNKLEHLKQIHIETRPFAELDLLTATFKKKRSEFKKHYQDLFDEMYKSLD